MYFATVHLGNETGVVSVRRVVRAINVVGLYQGLNEINFKIFIVFDCK